MKVLKDNECFTDMCADFLNGMSIVQLSCKYKKKCKEVIDELKKCQHIKDIRDKLVYVERIYFIRKHKINLDQVIDLFMNENKSINEISQALNIREHALREVLLNSRVPEIVEKVFQNDFRLIHKQLGEKESEISEFWQEMIKIKVQAHMQKMDYEEEKQLKMKILMGISNKFGIDPSIFMAAY